MRCQFWITISDDRGVPTDPATSQRRRGAS
jgi:hypothetical protein